MADRTTISFVASAVEVVQFKGGLSTGANAGENSIIVEKRIERVPEAAVSRDEKKLASRSLYDQLQTHKQAAEDAAVEREKDKFLPKGLDEDEVDFLENQQDLKLEADREAEHQARRDREAFSSAARAAAELREREADDRARSAMLGPAVAALRRGTLSTINTGRTGAGPALGHASRPSQVDSSLLAAAVPGHDSTSFGVGSTPSGQNVGQKRTETEDTTHATKRRRTEAKFGAPAPSAAALLGMSVERPVNPSSIGSALVGDYGSDDSDG